jgi:hypothetical protein
MPRDSKVYFSSCVIISVYSTHNIVLGIYLNSTEIWIYPFGLVCFIKQRNVLLFDKFIYTFIACLKGFKTFLVTRLLVTI